MVQKKCDTLRHYAKLTLFLPLQFVRTTGWPIFDSQTGWPRSRGGGRSAGAAALRGPGPRAAASGGQPARPNGPGSRCRPAHPTAAGRRQRGGGGVDASRAPTGSSPYTQQRPESTAVTATGRGSGSDYDPYVEKCT